MRRTATMILLMLGAVATPARAEVPAKPNIIYIMADDLGYGDIGAFNENCKIQTPNIDRIAS